MSPSVALPDAPQLSLLGEFGLSFGTERVQVRQPAQRLLAYLAVQRSRPVRRATLAERLWCDADPSHAAASLRTTLCRLPRRHEQALVTATPTHLALAPEVMVDLWQSEQAANAVTCLPPDCDDPGPESLGGAEDLGSPEMWEAFERDLLPDWCEDWLLVEQESHRQLRLHALEALSARLRDAGRYSEALMAGLSAVRSEPLRETAHMCVISAHLAEGNPAEALRQYQGYRRLIATELGLPPSAAIRALVAPVLGRPIDRAAGRPVVRPVARSVVGGADTARVR